MYDKVVIYESSVYNPYYNLAVEGVLADTVRENELKVFLWSNGNTVVIGRHQNAYLDVNVKRLLKEGGLLARRSTGGGAVYHDRGNLNFSFVTARKSYDLAQNNAIILNAVKKLGLNAEVNGRNDIVIGGKKFSGNAYLKTPVYALHHGTVLISADTSKMSGYLNVNPDKLKGKGVASVRARVVNLAELNGRIDVECVKKAIIEVLNESFLSVEKRELSELDSERISAVENEISRPEYIFGKNVKLGTAVYRKFDWGYADVHFTLCGGIISEIDLFSDALDTEAVESAKSLLSGASAADEFSSENQIASDVYGLIFK